MRKDIECVFGILKKRFLILKNPIRQQIKQNIERMFLTCCVLHNMTMEEEGLHDWMIDEDDEEVYDPLAKLVERNLRKKRKRGRNLGVAGMRSLNRELYSITENETDTADEQYLVNRERYRNRRDRLVTHYDWMKKNRLLMLELR